MTLTSLFGAMSLNTWRPSLCSDAIVGRWTSGLSCRAPVRKCLCVISLAIILCTLYWNLMGGWKKGMPPTSTLASAAPILSSDCTKDGYGMCTAAPEVRSTWRYRKTHEVLPAFQNYLTQIRYAEKYGLGTCVQPKTMSTILTNMMCYLFDAANFERNNISIVYDSYPTRFCMNRNEKDFIEDAYEAFPNIDFKWFMVVREPVQRFISTYVDKCFREQAENNSIPHCYNCEDQMDVECVVRNIELRAFRWAENVRSGYRLMSKGDDDYHVHYDSHFFPQNWHCDLGQYLHQFKVIKFCPPGFECFEAMLQEIFSLFKEKNVPQAMVDKIHKEVFRTTSGHSTARNPLRQELTKRIDSDPPLYRRIVRLYYFDYVLFNFPMPNGIDPFSGKV